MKQAKKAAATRKLRNRMTPAQRAELERARQIPTSGPFLGLQRFFRRNGLQ